MVTTQAVETPINNVPIETPIANQTVLQTYPTRTVSARCCHIPSDDLPRFSKISTSGPATIAAIKRQTTGHSDFTFDTLPDSKN